MKDYKKSIELASIFLKDYLEKTGFKGYVLGLSGGIDSAVSLGLAVRSVGKENIRCFALPCTSGSEKFRKSDLDDAQLVSDAFGVKLDVITLDEEATKLFIDTINYRNYGDLVLANIKARLRMTTLRALAEGLRYLVLGTTNKTEEYLGYYTKAGDGGGGVDIEPIADFFKYEIRELARELGVPEKIIIKSPSAGLWFDQTDEDEIGFKYDDIDKYLSIREDYTDYDKLLNTKVHKKFLNKNVDSSINPDMDIKWQNLYKILVDKPKIKSAKIDKKLIDRVERMIVNGNHKRNNPPFFNKKKYGPEI